MKNDPHTSNSRLGWLAGGAALVLAAALSASAQERTPDRASGPAGEPNGLVVGTYDSRGVAMAYIRSEATQAFLAATQKDLGHAIERARQAGDAALAERLEGIGAEVQLRFHRQGFGTAPIDDLLAPLAERLPELAREAGVDVLVSKWELDYALPGARFVDVTDRLAAEFHPSDEVWKGIHALVATDPVPLEEIRAEDGGH